MLNNSNIQSFNFALSDRIGQGEIWYSDKNKMGGSSIKNDVQTNKNSNNQFWNYDPDGDGKMDLNEF